MSLRSLLGMGSTMSAAMIELAAMPAVNKGSKGYYARYTGKSKTFKKNKRRGL